MSSSIYIVLVALVTQHAVHATVLEVNPETESEEQNNLLNQLLDLNREFSAKEALLTPENKDQCNKEKKQYVEKLTEYLKTKEDSAQVTEIKVKDELIPLQVITKTECSTSTSPLAGLAFIKDNIYDAWKSAADMGSDPNKAVQQLLNSDQGKQIATNFQKIQTQVTSNVQNLQDHEVVKTVVAKGQNLQQYLDGEINKIKASSKSPKESVNIISSKMFEFFKSQTPAKTEGTGETTSTDTPKKEEPAKEPAAE